MLFDLFYENMHHIAPGQLPYEQEKQQWLDAVSPALEKDPRKILLCSVDDALAGYVQYYTNGNLLMIEEIQVQKVYQRTTVFYRICRYLMDALSDTVEYIEAYADRRNANSQAIMKKLGMESINEDKTSPFVHLRGVAHTVRKHFTNKETGQ